MDDGLPETTDELAVLDNFENGLVNFSNVLQPMEGTTMTVVDNPSPDAVNGSAKVLEVARPEGSAAWAGFYARLNANAAPKCDMDKYRYARFKVLQDMECDSASFKVEVPQGRFFETKSAITKVNEWEEIIFDMDAAEGTYPQIAIMPDYEVGRPTHKVYVDDIMFSKELDVDVPGTGIDMLQVAGTVRTLTTATGVEVLSQTTDAAEVNLNVYDTAGRLVASSAVDAVAGENRVPVNFEGEGIFLLKVGIDNRAVVSKFYK